MLLFSLFLHKTITGEFLHPWSYTISCTALVWFRETNFRCLLYFFCVWYPYFWHQAEILVPYSKFKYSPWTRKRSGSFVEKGEKKYTVQYLNVVQYLCWPIHMMHFLERVKQKLKDFVANPEWSIEYWDITLTTLIVAKVLTTSCVWQYEWNVCLVVSYDILHFLNRKFINNRGCMWVVIISRRSDRAQWTT